MSKKYRAAVIGRTGRGGYGHGLDVAFKALPNIEVVAVADENQRGRQEAVRRLGVKRAYADYREMLAKERPDIVSVAPRWVDCHLDMVLACAEYGAHIYMEKPMARTLQEADAMIDAMERRHLKLAIAHQMRLSPVIARVRELILRGEIGQLLEMRGRGKEDSRAGGEDLIVLGTHIMDLMRLFAGDPIWTFAHVTVDGKEIAKSDVRDGNEGLGPLAGNRISAMYAFAGGPHGYFASHESGQKEGARYGLDLYGTRGMISIRAAINPTAYIFRSKSWAPTEEASGWEKIEVPIPKQDSELLAKGFDSTAVANARIIADLLKAIEEERQPASSGYDGRWALEMILSVYESQRTGSRVALPMRERKHPLERLA